MNNIKLAKFLIIIISSLFFFTPVYSNEQTCEGNCINGYGTYTWPDGGKYVGEWKDGKRNGQGTRTWPDGRKYEGEWKDDNREGQGSFRWSDAEKYVGEWKDDHREGQGTYTWLQERYVGEWKYDKREGQGTYTWPDGRKYVGEWKYDKQEGEGTFTWPNGDKYVGEWKNDKQEGQGTFTWPNGDKYVGEWKNDRLEGQGTLIWPSGDKYVGEWKDYKKDGKGTLTWHDGHKYVGEWKDDKKEGQGTFTWPNGNKYVGGFTFGYLEGQGTFTWPDGNKYVGEFKNGHREGQGSYYSKNDKIKYFGYWKSGNIYVNGKQVNVDQNGNFDLHLVHKIEYENIMSYANSENYSQAIIEFNNLNKNNKYYKELSSKVNNWRKFALNKNNKNEYENIMSYANSGNYSQAISSFYYMNKNNTYYKEVSKKIPTWKKLQAKKDLDNKYYSELNNAKNYANNNQYNQAIYYAQKISKKNPYYKEAQMKILQWKDDMLNIGNNSNSNNNSYSTPTYTQPDNSALIQQQRNNCRANCKAARSICDSNCEALSSKSTTFTFSPRFKCKRECDLQEYRCKNQCG